MKPSGKLIPNTTPLPNILIEQIAPMLSSSSLRVLLAIARKTYGFHKKSDKISFKQLEALTGLSRPSVNAGIKGLGPLLKTVPGDKNSPTLNGVTSYEINVDISTEELVKKLYWLKKFTSKKRPSELVKKVNSPKENTKDNIRSGLRPSSLHPTPVPEKEDKHRAPCGVPSEFKFTVERVIARMNELAGTAYRSESKIVLKGLIPRLRAGATEADCLIVVEDRWREWGEKPEMRQYFNPETLFRESNFEKYRNAAAMGNGRRAAGGFVG